MTHSGLEVLTLLLIDLLEETPEDSAEYECIEIVMAYIERIKK